MFKRKAASIIDIEHGGDRELQQGAAIRSWMQLKIMHVVCIHTCSQGMKENFF